MLLGTDGVASIGLNFVLSGVGVSGAPAPNPDKHVYAGDLSSLEDLRGDAHHVDMA